MFDGSPWIAPAVAVAVLVVVVAERAVRRSSLPTRWMLWGTALVSLAAGSLATARLTHSNPLAAEGDRVFELNVYHAARGKAPALERRFRDAARLLARHDLTVVGYWVPDDDDPAWADTFVYVVAHSSRAEAKKNWDAFHADPAFQEFVRAEEADKLIERVDRTYMRATEFSPMR